MDLYRQQSCSRSYCFLLVKNCKQKDCNEKAASNTIDPVCFDTICTQSSFAAVTLVDGVDNLCQALTICSACKICSSLYNCILSLQPDMCRLEDRHLVKFSKFDSKMWANIGSMEQLFVSFDPTDQVYDFALLAIVCF